MKLFLNFCLILEVLQENICCRFLSFFPVSFEKYVNQRINQEVCVPNNKSPRCIEPFIDHYHDIGNKHRQYIGESNTKRYFIFELSHIFARLVFPEFCSLSIENSDYVKVRSYDRNYCHCAPKDPYDSVCVGVYPRNNSAYR